MTYSSKRRFGAGSSSSRRAESERNKGFCGWEVEVGGVGRVAVVSVVEGPEETRLDCVRGATGGATVAGGCIGGGDESGFRGATTLKPGPNVKGDCEFGAESPRDGGSPLLLEGPPCVEVDGPADMILVSAVSRIGRFGEEVGWNHCTPTSA